MATEHEINLKEIQQNFSTFTPQEANFLMQNFTTFKQIKIEKNQHSYLRAVYISAFKNLVAEYPKLYEENSL